LQLEEAIGVSSIHRQLDDSHVGHDRTQLSARGFDLRGVGFDGYCVGGAANLQRDGNEIDVADCHDDILRERFLKALSVGAYIVTSDSQFRYNEGAIIVRRDGADRVRAGQRRGDCCTRHNGAGGVVDGAADFPVGLRPCRRSPEQYRKRQQVHP